MKVVWFKIKRKKRTKIKPKKYIKNKNKPKEVKKIKTNPKKYIKYKKKKKFICGHNLSLWSIFFLNHTLICMFACIQYLLSWMLFMLSDVNVLIKKGIGKI